MRLDVESLRALQAASNRGSFKKAAALLGMTQSAVSWKIKRLEERVGVELLERTSPLSPTAHGAQLLTYADTIIETHDKAVESLTKSELRGSIRLGTNEDRLGGHLATVLARFNRIHPSIELTVRAGLSGLVNDWLESDEVDVAIIQLPTNQLHADDEMLWADQLRWYRGRGASFTDHGTAQNPLPIITFGAGLAYLDSETDALRYHGVQHRTLVECPTLAGVQRAVEAGLGVAALHSRNATPGMTEWLDGDQITLPEVAEVIRSALPTEECPADIRALKHTLRHTLKHNLTPAQ